MKRNRFSPKHVDLSNGLQSTFGCCEFESAACEILRYLNDDSRPYVKCDPWMGHQADGKGWDKPFRIQSLEINPTMFAMLCACGWITACWFPKGIFTVSNDFVDRLWEKQQKELDLDIKFA